MGDAVRDGDVHHDGDPEDTIDAASPRPEPPPSGLPVEVIAATRDHGELHAVERRHYAITREIARGGIGRVFEARDLRLGRQVAIKELLPRNRDAARRFEREARITARLQHPAIIHVYEAGVWPGGEPFYAMPLVAGRSLDKVVAERATLDARLALLPNVIAVADALAYAHNASVIHRDLKPANVLVGEFGETVVIDWGLAKELGAASDPKESLEMRLRATCEGTLAGGIVGTPAYMPPEQARGEAVDQRADVYALGALLYKVLSGKAPYTGANAAEILEQVKAHPPVPVQQREPGAPSDLIAIVTKAMARDPDDRYVTASELAQDLKRFETGQLVGAHSYTARELLRRWLHRHRVAVSITAAAVLALIAFGVFFVQRIVTEKRRADAERDLAVARRVTLLEERGRSELLAHNAGNALAYLVGAAHDGKIGGARGFLIAEAMQPFAAEVAHIPVGRGDVVVAASPDGRWIATAGDGPIELRTPDGGLVRSFGTHGVTRVVSFDSTSTKLVAAGDDGIARVWTLPDGQVTELPGHRGAILDAELSPDGRTLVTTGADASVRIWELARRRVTVIDCHAKPVVSARFSRDGEEVLTASADATACLIEHHGPIERSHGQEWNIERQIKGHTAAVNSAEWSADGRFIVTASDDETARVWSHSRGKPVYASGLRHELGTVVQRALMTEDGLIVTAGSDHVVRLWELPASIPDDGTSPPPVRPPRKLPGHTGRIVVAALSADSRQLVTGGLDGLAKVWALPSGLELATFEHGNVVTSVAFVPGTTLLVTGSRDGTARIWNTHVTDPIDLGNAARAIAIAPDGSVAAALADSLVRIARAGQSEPLDLEGHLAIPLAVAFTPDGSRLVSAGEDAAAIIWDPRTGRQLARLAATEQDPPPPIRALAALPDGDRVALVRDGNVEVWSLATRSRVLLLAPPRGRVDALAIDPVTGAIAAVGEDGTFVVWDARGLVLQARTDRGSPYHAVAFSPAGDALVTAGAGFADVRPVIGGIVGRIDVTLEGGMGVVRAVLVTPDGSRIITGGDNGLAMIWDRHKGKLLGTRDHRDRPITALAVRGDTLWVGSEDPLLTSWPIRVETAPADALERFMIAKHVPVELHADVLRKRTP